MNFIEKSKIYAGVVCVCEGVTMHAYTFNHRKVHSSVNKLFLLLLLLNIALFYGCVPRIRSGLDTSLV